MLGRPILKKQVCRSSLSLVTLILTRAIQTSYSLYRPAAIVIANTLADMPFSIIRIFVYNIIIYFMAGLARSAGGFFTFQVFVSVILFGPGANDIYIISPDLYSVLDNAGLLPKFWSIMLELRSSIPNRYLLRSQYDTIRRLYDSGVDHEEMVILDCAYLQFLN